MTLRRDVARLLAAAVALGLLAALLAAIDWRLAALVYLTAGAAFGWVARGFRDRHRR